MPCSIVLFNLREMFALDIHPDCVETRPGSDVDFAVGCYELISGQAVRDDDGDAVLHDRPRRERAV